MNLQASIWIYVGFYEPIVQAFLYAFGLLLAIVVSYRPYSFYNICVSLFGLLEV